MKNKWIGGHLFLPGKKMREADCEEGESSSRKKKRGKFLRPANHARMKTRPQLKRRICPRYRTGGGEKEVVSRERGHSYALIL